MRYAHVIAPHHHEKGIGSHFDPDCVAAFFACEDDIRAMYEQPTKAAE